MLPCLKNDDPPLGVAVECCYPDHESYSISGIKLSKHFVLTSAILVIDFITSSLVKYIKDLPNISELVTSDLKLLEFKVFEDAGVKNQKVVNSSKAKLLHFWFDYELALDIHQMLPSGMEWQFSSEVTISKEWEASLATSFLILEICPGGDLSEIVRLWTNEVTSLEKGAPLLLEATPFGSKCLEMCLNSWSYGIISTVSSSNRCFITDARSLPGSEGGCGFLYNGDKIFLCGIVLSPFCLLTGEWMGFTLMCSAKEVLKNFQKRLQKSERISNQKLKSISINNNNILHSFTSNSNLDLKMMKDALEEITECIVKIECVDSCGCQHQGTGTIISRDPGIVVTCGHVVEWAHKNVVSVIEPDGRIRIGTVVYLHDRSDYTSHPSHHRDIWDLALISINGVFSKCLNFSEELPKKGTPVIVGGYVLPPKIFQQPFFSLGILSKIVEYPESHFYYMNDSLNRFDSSLNVLRKDESSPPLPVYLQTSSYLFKGSSGGPIVSVVSDATNDSAMKKFTRVEVIGIGSCCIGIDSHGIKYPELNLSVCVLHPLKAIKEFIKTRDERCLESLHLKVKKWPFESNKNIPSKL